MIKAGIIGGAGYTAGELIRILLNHPQVQLIFVNSTSNAGNRLSDVHGGLLGETDMRFTDQLPYDKIDVLFFCTAHGDTKKFMEANDVPKNLKIIDLSTDYRHKAEGNNFIYGLPELNKEQIKKSSYIANPGCFATAIQLALLPLAKADQLNAEIHVNAITGSTGAGVKPSATSHFSWRENNISVYKAFEHQHLTEIKQSLTQLQGNFDQELNFIPVRGNFTRGIFATIYLNYSGTLEDAEKLYADFYKDSPFVVVTDQNPDLKQVVNTNKCVLHLEKHGNKLLILSCIDNLVKGASGQAVQNMNLIFGLEETEGLKLKASAF
ncbi:N-acetyl-gamma-glutamyl-phosphate reductase [Dysgonomonas sp. PFB1-18]|uniref:N-acetyl-gamma-glutamyl-phosphate reductase n=1 Tax=unclassified Dysgonomonas TaxID=2630389 RepID=UPI002473F3BA|nr:MULTISPECIES: N-acetyl-gamma-glutamyl-phosphate reductase [unclassified Dysgonomonas]MDH6308624.1 N-acetyl-gamma-glutamyl-phosphate reductase [Dysgonomonas sp. PF1-14]MDH6338125.1 N-acetyl-gamma-glutamyl-phosphate reductase [Dysgonomonas sp. PF1-16]MDH6379622.1 N-acetyl-gamma-glutamyl-phosphate reductase [Dysgonomonas sp. PFB1-18]MDH6396952.1 N-acetyl-gamma-glutamyl-phosphate reductase [Dysgonomonas sp. PF1-23]